MSVYTVYTRNVKKMENFVKIEQNLQKRYGEDQYREAVQGLYNEGWNWEEIKAALRVRESC